MADFSVNSTNLSGPQGAGANVLAPVETAVDKGGISPLLSGIVDVFAKGLTQNRKEEQDKRKANVVGAYAKEIGRVNDALATGQKNAAWAGAQTRAITNKYLASSPEYTTEIAESHKAFIGGTEIGPAQKEEEAAIKIRNDDISAASQSGATFYPGMSEEAQNKTIDAHKYGIRVEAQAAKDAAAVVAERAARGEVRTEQTWQQSNELFTAKKNAQEGLLTFANANFDAFNAVGRDLIANPNLTFDQKKAIVDSNVSRIEMGLLSISKSNNELASPYKALFTEMSTTLRATLDPNIKSAADVKKAQDDYNAAIAKFKLMTVTNDPKALAAASLTSMFGPDAIIKLNIDSSLGIWMAQAGQPLDPKTEPPKTVIGTTQGDNTVKAFQAMLKASNSSGVPISPAIAREHLNVANTLIKQTAEIRPDTPPAQLKALATFFGSSEFGDMAKKGVEMESMQNAQNVFTSLYSPVVKQAIMERLNKPINSGFLGIDKGTVLDNIDIKFSGSGVVFSSLPSKGGSSMSTFTQAVAKKDLDDSAKALNQLVRIGAHMERTTDYAKYWEDNRHLLMPEVFPDPTKLKVGQKIKATNGKTYEYIGGNFNNIKRSYVEVSSGTSE